MHSAVGRRQEVPKGRSFRKVFPKVNPWGKKKRFLCLKSQNLVLILADPPDGKTVDCTSVDEFRKLLDLNLVNYFIFCKVSKVKSLLIKCKQHHVKRPLLDVIFPKLEVILHFITLSQWSICIIFQFALPHLRKTKGNIINISSLVAQIGQPGAVAYVASKVDLDFSNSQCFTPICMWLADQTFLAPSLVFFRIFLFFATYKRLFQLDCRLGRIKRKCARCDFRSKTRFTPATQAML